MAEKKRDSTESETLAVPSLEGVTAAVRLLFRPGQVVELRAFGLRGLKVKKRFTLSGYYDNHDRMAEDAIKMSTTPGVYGAFWSLQIIKPALLSRSPNRYIEGPAATTSDVDVAWYSWLPVDSDPVRPPGVSATDAEKEKALEVVERVAALFREQGVTTVCADSGNGYHLLVAVQLGVKDAPLVARVLAALDERFSTDDAKIDRVNFNPARIFKVYGTVARKGEASEERPHRTARLLSTPDTIPTCASRELLETIAAAAPPEREKKKGKKAETGDIEKIAAKVEEFLAEGKVVYEPRLDYKDGFKWLLEKCPFNSDHVAPSIIVTVAESGAMGFRCSHNSCFDKLWPDFRQNVEAKIGHAFVFRATAPPLDPEHIVTNPGHVSEMIRRSEAVLYGFGLKYFERNNELVNTAFGRDVAKLKDIERSADSVVIQPASPETILRDLDSRAVFVRRIETSLGTIEKVVHVPKLLPDQLHDRVRSEVRDVIFPTLDMVTASPVLLPSGTVHGVGQIFEEGVMFIGGHTKRFPLVPEHPTHGDAVRALRQFDDIFRGFPFVDPGSEGLNWKLTTSYSVALAAVLSLVGRPHLSLSAIPIIGATAPSRRSGKTKIIEAACMASLGHRPTACHFTDEQEFDKHVQPLMRAGDRAILIDNVERPLQSSKLCILVTGGVLRDRVLGESRDVILKNYAVIFATGNNLVFGGDLSARAIRSDIDPKLERSESRAFSFDPVKLAQERHPQLVVAALTMLRAYLLANAPWNLKREPWGGFDRWDKLVSGCLTWLGAADPYMARERIIAADPVRMSNLDVLEDWYLRYKDRPVSFTEIRADKGAVYESLLKHGTWDGYHARWILRRLEGQTIGGYILRRTGGRSQFQVLKSGESQGEMYARAEELPATVEEPPLAAIDEDIPF